MAGSGYVVAPASDSSSSSAQQQQQIFTPTALSIIEQIFSTIDIDSNGNISVEEAEKILLRLNSRLNRNYGENEVAQFFHSLDSNRDGKINLNEFKAAFQRLL
jgi:Ca2+-binding EF-hand superfamily protein